MQQRLPLQHVGSPLAQAFLHSHVREPKAAPARKQIPAVPRCGVSQSANAALLSQNHWKRENKQKVILINTCNNYVQEEKTQTVANFEYGDSGLIQQQSSCHSRKQESDNQGKALIRIIRK